VNPPRLRTALIGFGKMASGYARDAVMARHYRYCTHAQVLAANARFEWRAVVDPSEAARRDAQEHWTVPAVVDRVRALDAVAREIDVAVLATPPDARLEIIDELPNLRAVLVEKPLGTTLQAGASFLARCRERGILVQVNLWRRGDELFRRLADGELRRMVGAPQAVTGYYGNGLLNNGTHLVDFLRMLFGEIHSVAPLGERRAFEEGPIAGDSNPGFLANFPDGLVASVHALRFSEYREVGLDIWGESGRLALLNEGLSVLQFQRVANRAMTGEREIAADAPQTIAPTVGVALYRMYDNLADAVHGIDSVWSPGDSALRTAAVIEAIGAACRERRTVSIGSTVAQH
jgi:predicted dehydrogenase